MVSYEKITKERNGEFGMRFSGICLITKDVPRLVDFYMKVFQVNAEGNDIHSELNIGGSNFAIFSEKEMEKLAPNSMNEAGYGSFTISFEVEDIEKEYARIKDLGVQFITQPTSYPWGNRAFWFRDPDGNIISIYSTIK